MNKKTVIAIVAIIFVIGCSFIISMKDSNQLKFQAKIYQSRLRI